MKLMIVNAFSTYLVELMATAISMFVVSKDIMSYCLYCIAHSFFLWIQPCWKEGQVAQ